MQAVHCVTDPSHAAALLHPLRLRVLEEAREAASATEIAGRIGEARQKVNYHVRELAKAGFLRPAEQRRRGNLIEQRYVATARSYLLAPQVVGALGAGLEVRSGAAEREADRLSADHLLALTARAQAEIAEVREAAGAEDKRLATLSLSVDLAFTDAEQRAAFAAALRDAVTDVVGRFSVAAPGEEGAGRPRPYRLILGCYPPPRRPSATQENP
jgi:DNA-binding transcriptional ArsR family regulator